MELHFYPIRDALPSGIVATTSITFTAVYHHLTTIFEKVLAQRPYSNDYNQPMLGYVHFPPKMSFATKNLEEGSQTRCSSLRALHTGDI